MIEQSGPKSTNLSPIFYMQHFAVQIYSCPAGQSWIRDTFAKVYTLIMQCNFKDAI